MWVIVGARTVHTAEALLTSFFQHWREQEEGVPTCSERREDPWSRSHRVNWVCSSRLAFARGRERNVLPPNKEEKEQNPSRSQFTARQTDSRQILEVSAKKNKCNSISVPSGNDNVPQVAANRSC